tara:strand:- start:455 stop:964 length:510 start_codon:yes stop_codon:yes gene_type:complete
MLKKYKNIFLDRDGVINKIIKRGNVISSPRNFDEFYLRDDFLEFCKKIKEKDLVFFICTNQPDLKRNLLNVVDLENMHAKIKEHIEIREILFCGHDDIDNCNCRKPKPGMILEIINKYKLNKNDCLMIGDSQKDIDAARFAKINAYLLEKDYNKNVDCNNRINSLVDLI